MAIVVSHIDSDFDALCKRALRQAPLADLIELRLDRIGNPGEVKFAAFVQSCPKPIIVTIHGPELFGDFQGDVDERLDILHMAARAGAKFVDVDYRLSLDLGEVERPCHRIVSRHELEGTPDSLEELAAMHEEIRDVQYEGDATKLVTHAERCEDGLLVMQYLRREPGLIAFCTGEAGSFTRTLGPIFGSAFTYCAPAAMPGEPEPEKTAPGQLRVNDLLTQLPPGGVTPGTSIFAVVGNPISGSWSPRLQGMAFKSAGFDAIFTALEPTDFDLFLERADDENFRGFSVTAPYKNDAFRLAKDRDEATERAQTCNTLLRDGERWRASNTDIPAIRETLERAFQIHGQIPGRPVAFGAATTLILGTGGAARAALDAVRLAGGRGAIAGRDLEKARALAQEFGAEAVAWDDIGEFPYDALVNCTPVGSLADPDRSPLPDEALRPATVVLDAVYRPLRTPLLMAAKKKGCTAIPGGEWFVRQAQAQYQLFTRKEPDEALMRATFDMALKEDAG